jgi:hypothetical protein
MSARWISFARDLSTVLVSGSESLIATVNAHEGANGVCDGGGVRGEGARRWSVQGGEEGVGDIAIAGSVAQSGVEGCSRVYGPVEVALLEEGIVGVVGEGRLACSSCRGSLVLDGGLVAGLHRMHSDIAGSG